MAEFTGEITPDIYEVMRNHPHYNKYLSPNEQRYLLSTPDAKNVSEMPVTNVQYNNNAAVDLTEPNYFDNMTQQQIAARLAEIDTNFANIEKKWNIPITLDTQNSIPMNANTFQNSIPMSANTSQGQSVSGLFTPELNNLQANLYQQEQQRAMQAQAMQFAKLSPIEQAQYGLFYGGQQLGGLAGNALGAKDPQLQMISLQQQILRELDPSNPQQNLMIAQKYSQVAPELAMKIADNARISLVKIKQASGAARQNIAAKVQEAEAYASKFGGEGTNEYNNAYKAYLQGTDKLPEKQSTGARVAEITRILSPESGGLLLRPSERAALEAELATYERPEKQLSLTSDRDAISAELYENKPFAEITPAQKAIVNKRVEEESRAKAKAGAIILPGQAVPPKDWLAFSSQISKDPVMDRTSTIIADAPNAIETIRLSTSNDFASASLPGALARLTGEGKNMSNADISRYARTGGLTDRVAQDVVGFFTGQKTSVTKEQAERFATAVYRGALLERKKFIQDQAEQAGYKDTPNYAIAIRQLDDQLAKFKLIKPNEKTSSEQKQTSSDDELINKYLKPK